MFFYERGQHQALKDIGVPSFQEKNASWLMGPIGHLGVNALGRAAHKSSNLATVLAHKGLQHGFTNSAINPAAMKSIVAIAGPETMGVYQAAQMAGKRLAEAPPHLRPKILKQVSEAGFDEHTPMVGALQEAAKHELAGTAPKLEAKGLGAKAYSKFVDSMSDIKNTPFDTKTQRTVRTMGGAAPSAGLTAVDPSGSAAHFGINLAREQIGKSSYGKKVMGDLFESGVQGNQPSKLKETVIDYAVSPSVLDPQRMGRAMKEKGLTPDLLQQGKQYVQEAQGNSDLLDAAREIKQTGKRLWDESPLAESNMPAPATSIAKTGQAKSEDAPGIPDRSKTSPLPDVREPQNWTLSVQEHKAERAGPHYDLRLIDPATSEAHSWAIPRARLPEPGESVLAIQQPTHTQDYATSFGKDQPQRIESGYGKGEVSIKELTDAEVYHSKPQEEGTRMRFNVYRSTGPEEYAIVKTKKGDDLLVNKTMTRKRVPYLPIGKKPKVKEQDIGVITLDDLDEVMMPKYDGTHTYLDMQKSGKIPRLYSYREPKKHKAGVIEQTHKVPMLLKTRVPKELEGTSLDVETVGVDNSGRAIEARHLAGMMNATVPNSRNKQKEMGAELRPIALDVKRYKGKDVSQLPFSARYELLKEVNKKAKIPIAETAWSPSEKKDLLEKVRQGRHPLTAEGVVLRPISKPGYARKAKIRPDHDVYVRNIFPAYGKSGEPKDRAGGFEYSWSPHGQIVGRVGTGFDHTTARDMLQNPEQYKGRVAKVEAERKFPSGKLSKPAFKEWHLEKGDIEKYINGQSKTGQHALRGFFREFRSKGI